MCKLLISIKPEYVNDILNGVKKYEYRRVKPKRKDISKLVIYSTSPVKKVVGEVEVIEILDLPPEELWKRTSCDSGISKSFYDKYYDGKEKAYAFKLGNVIQYEIPKNLDDVGIDFVPQSFLYLDN